MIFKFGNGHRVVDFSITVSEGNMPVHRPDEEIKINKGKQNPMLFSKTRNLEVPEKKDK